MPWRRAPEPVVNALANRSERAHGKEELAAVIAIARRDRERAPAAGLTSSAPIPGVWRLLHANLAITAIRTEEASLMDSAAH
jgi:hypothetical protein